MCVDLFENQTDAGLCQVRSQRSVDRFCYSIELHSFNPDVIVKIFCVSQSWRGTTDVHVERRRAVG